MRTSTFTLLVLFIFGTFRVGYSFAAPLNPGRADLIELTISAPVVVRAEVVKASKLSAKLSPGIAPGATRFLVRAKLANVLVAPGFVPQEIEYLVDLTPESGGKIPKLKGLPLLLFLDSSRLENQYRLVSKWGQIDWTAEREAYVRTIARESLQPGARDYKVTGLGQAFHVAGSLPGEGESQIFVQTESGRPVSLVVLSRPGQRRALSVATGDIIDEAASDVRSGSLLWYQLACGLPKSLPAGSTETLEENDATAARADYAFVIDALGTCDRSFNR